MKILKRIGPRTEPWGTPEGAGDQLEKEPRNDTLNLWFRK